MLLFARFNIEVKFFYPFVEFFDDVFTAMHAVLADDSILCSAIRLAGQNNCRSVLLGTADVKNDSVGHPSSLPSAIALWIVPASTRITSSSPPPNPCLSLARSRSP